MDDEANLSLLAGGIWGRRFDHIQADASCEGRVLSTQ